MRACGVVVAPGTLVLAGAWLLVMVGERGRSLVFVVTGAGARVRGGGGVVVAWCVPSSSSSSSSSVLASS